MPTSARTRRNTGILTPAMLSVRPSMRQLASKEPSRTLFLKSPAAYCAAVSEKNAAPQASAIVALVA